MFTNPDQIQQIIVYRNPMEAALYNSGMTFPIMCAAFVMLVMTLVSSKIIELLLGKRKFNNNAPYAGLTVGFIFAVLTLWWML